MRTFNLSIIFTLLVTFLSCGGNTSNQTANAEGFSTIEKAIKEQFGNDAFYTDLTITYNASIGNIIGVTVTKAPESLKMEQWNLTQDNWQQNSDITIEIPEGTQAADFMFQLDDNINLSKLGELVEQSKTQLEADKALKNTKLYNAFIKYPDNGDMNNAEYTVMLQPENGGTTFTYSYKLNGELINMDY